MAGMTAEEADRFCEEDEDPREVFAVFDAAEKGRTAPTEPASGAGRPVAWADRLRHDIAMALRRAANAIDSSCVRAR
jgi:hypothetical protein